jgi:hypothetical protein
MFPPCNRSQRRPRLTTIGVDCQEASGVSDTSKQQTRASRNRIRGRGRRGSLPTLLIAATLVAACGGAAAPGVANVPTATPTPGTAAPKDGPAAPAANATPNGPAYAQCMRSHGVANFPDPQGPDQNAFLISSSVQDNPNFQSASKACAPLRPQQNGGGSGGGVSQQQLLAFAQCMRQNGVPNFPDPAPDGAVSLGGVNPNSPQFQSARQTCEAKTGLQLGSG